MTLPRKCILRMPEDLSLDLSHPHEKLNTVAHLCHRSAGERAQAKPLSSLDSSSQIYQLWVLKK